MMNYDIDDLICGQARDKILAVISQAIIVEKDGEKNEQFGPKKLLHSVAASVFTTWLDRFKSANNLDRLKETLRDMGIEGRRSEEAVAPLAQQCQACLEEVKAMRTNDQHLARLRIIELERQVATLTEVRDSHSTSITELEDRLESAESKNRQLTRQLEQMKKGILEIVQNPNFGLDKQDSPKTAQFFRKG